MTGTVAQISILQTCQSTSNSNDLQPPGPNMESTPLGTNRTLQKLWSTLVPYLSVDMAEFIVSSPESNLRAAGKKQELTVLFADIRGFTSLAEVLDPEDCVSILNDYFCLAVDAVLDFGGTVDKFQGDCVMATFGSIPGLQNHEHRAVQCALRLRGAVRGFRIPKIPGGRIRLGIGVNTGVVIVGRVGSNRRMDYTAIGDVVNVAHRLQSISKPDQILISEATWRRVEQDLNAEALGPLQLKGRTEPIDTYSVQNLATPN